MIIISDGFEKNNKNFLEKQLEPNQANEFSKLLNDISSQNNTDNTKILPSQLFDQDFQSLLNIKKGIS